MTISTTIWTRMLALAALGAALTVAPAQAGKLDDLKQQGFVRGATANEVPYGFMDEDGKPAGIGPEVAMAVLESMGLKEMQWVVTPFGTLIPGLRANRYDLVAAEMNILPDRCRAVDFSEPNSSYGEGLLVKAGNPRQLHGYEDIKRNPAVKVAIVSGADQIDFLHAMGVPDAQIVIIPNNADGLSTVETGRADAYAATELTVARIAAGRPSVAVAAPFADPVVNGKPARSYGGFDFRQADKDLSQAFNAALASFKKTPRWRRILLSHGLSEESVAAAERATTAQLCGGK